MPTEAMRAEFARQALDCYARAHASFRRWRYAPNGDEIAECDIVDLVTDLLLLARQRGHDPCQVISKAEGHLCAETGLVC